VSYDYATADPACRKARSLVQESLDRPLSNIERRGLEMHLASCEACRSYGRELADLRATLHALPPAQLPEHVLQRVWSATLHGRSPAWHRRITAWQPMAAAAVIVLAVLWHQLAAPPASPAVDQAELDRLAADTQLVLKIACEAVSRAQHVAAQDVLQDRVHATLERIPVPWPADSLTPAKEMSRESDS
jgi:anti-sigma factor RsiW